LKVERPQSDVQTDEGKTSASGASASRSTSSHPSRRDFSPWTARQRSVILGLVILLFVYLTSRAVLHRQYVADPQPINPSRAAELADRIDPNTADAATQAALPSIGEKRARDIVAYREQFVADHPGRVAFRSAADLLPIKGFGGAIVSSIEPYLLFPAALASQPIPQ
jgi:hypothetical protein